MFAIVEAVVTGVAFAVVAVAAVVVVVVAIAMVGYCITLADNSELETGLDSENSIVQPA